MATHVKSDARLNFRLGIEHKKVIEEAASTLGQSVSDFAIATLVHSARTVIQQRNATELTNRDRGLFIALLDNASSRPNKALVDAARRYKKSLG